MKVSPMRITPVLRGLWSISELIPGDSRRRAGVVTLATLVAFLIIITAVLSAGPRPFVNIDVDQDRAYEDMVYLTSFPNRLTGSENEAKAATYIADQFRDAGLTNVHDEEYMQTCYDVISASMTLNQWSLVGTSSTSLRHMWDFDMQGYSGSTRPVTLSVVSVGGGDEAGFDAAGDVRGKAVFADPTDKHGISGVALRAAEHGAAAVISITHVNPQYAISTSAAFDNESGHSVVYPDVYPDKIIPSFVVSPPVGEQILEGIQANRNLPLVGDTFTVTLAAEVIIEKRPMHVVYGDLKGTSGDFIMTGAHHDSSYNSPGASDNAVGAVNVIAMARGVAEWVDEGNELTHTIRFATWGGEEEGLLGSTSYYFRHQDEVEDHMINYVNLDCTDLKSVGPDTPVLPLCVSDLPSEALWNETAAFIESQEPGLDERYDYTTCGGYQPTGWSDMAPFYLHGHDVSAIWGSGPFPYHTPGDTIDHVEPESWPYISKIVASWMLAQAW